MRQPLDISWFLPTAGDWSFPGSGTGHPPAEIGYRHREEAHRVAELPFPVLGVGQRVFDPGRAFAAPARTAAA
jgi:hypothetical protein